MIPVGRLAPTGQWDQNLLVELFANRVYPTGLEFSLTEGYPTGVDGCCLIIPGRYWHKDTDRINEAIATYRWVLAFRASDEEDWFDPARVSHPNIKWWVQSPKVGVDYHDARFFSVGWSPEFNDAPVIMPDKTIDAFLAGQNTHARRRKAFAMLAYVDNAVLLPTDGFTKGLPPAEYAAQMRAAKVAPCPSGAVCPDTFRFWEALQSHAIPIADDISPVYDSRGFWAQLLPGAPFPVVTDLDCLNGYTRDMIRAWPESSNVVTTWFMQYKRQLARHLVTDLKELGAHI